MDVRLLVVDMPQHAVWYRGTVQVQRVPFDCTVRINGQRLGKRGIGAAVVGLQGQGGDFHGTYFIRRDFYGHQEGGVVGGARPADVVALADPAQAGTFYPGERILAGDGAVCQDNEEAGLFSRHNGVGQPGGDNLLCYGRDGHAEEE